MFVEFPKTCTSIKAFVFLFIFFIKSFVSIFNVNGSTSTKTGFNPDWIIGHNEVDQQTVGINTESPDVSLLFLYGLIKHCKANKLADEPEFTIKENFVLIFFEKLFSKFFVCLPIVIFPVFITLIALSKSFFLYGFSNNG